VYERRIPGGIVETPVGVLRLRRRKCSWRNARDGSVLNSRRNDRRTFADWANESETANRRTGENATGKRLPDARVWEQRSPKRRRPLISARHYSNSVVPIWPRLIGTFRNRSSPTTATTAATYLYIGRRNNVGRIIYVFIILASRGKNVVHRGRFGPSDAFKLYGVLHSALVIFVNNPSFFPST